MKRRRGDAGQVRCPCGDGRAADWLASPVLGLRAGDEANQALDG